MSTMKRTLKFAFVKANWHAEIVTQSLNGFRQKADESEHEVIIEVFDVPGAFEMPLLAKRLARTGTYDAIAAAALVVDGGIYRHDYVAQAVVTGLMDVQLTTDVPILSVSLTPHHFQLTAEHTDFFFRHFLIKGQEAFDAAQAVALSCVGGKHSVASHSGVQ
ncbi:6,7-dimethyl-8-ribityllumazine synthase [Roseovarius aestuarii]|nr:6,7-dimethyl-8-ribityllumazine synthase [Roseovarius aestuarii]